MSQPVVILFQSDYPFHRYRRMELKPLNNDPRSFSAQSKHYDIESKIANKDNISNIRGIPSEKDAEHPGTAEEDELNNLIQVGRSLSHQLNNLLTTILANTQLMFLIVKDAELKSHLKAVENATRDAGTVVRKFQESVRTTAKLYSKNMSDGTQQFNR